MPWTRTWFPDGVWQSLAASSPWWLGLGGCPHAMLSFKPREGRKGHGTQERGVALAGPRAPKTHGRNSEEEDLCVHL